MPKLITVSVKSHGWLSKYFPQGDTQSMLLPEDSQVKDIVERFSLPVEATSVIVNGKKSVLEQPLKDGDFVSLYPIVFGG